jgi:hypothetical protein
MSSKNWAASNGVGKKVVWLVGQFGFMSCCLQACAVSTHWGGPIETTNNSHIQTKTHWSGSCPARRPSDRPARLGESSKSVMSCYVGVMQLLRVAQGWDSAAA